VKIKIESTESILTEYEEKEIEKIINELQVAQGIFGDSAMRCVYLLKAEKMLRTLISSITETFV